MSKRMAFGSDLWIIRGESNVPCSSINNALFTCDSVAKRHSSGSRLCGTAGLLIVPPVGLLFRETFLRIPLKRQVMSRFRDGEDVSLEYYQDMVRIVLDEEESKATVSFGGSCGDVTIPTVVAGGVAAVLLLFLPRIAAVAAILGLHGRCYPTYRGKKDFNVKVEGLPGFNTLQPK
eukprot:g63590.t1